MNAPVNPFGSIFATVPIYAANVNKGPGIACAAP